MGRRNFIESYVPEITEFSPPEDGSEYIATDDDEDVVLLDNTWVADDAVV